jgi:hypothetical protein
MPTLLCLILNFRPVSVILVTLFFTIPNHLYVKSTIPLLIHLTLYYLSGVFSVISLLRYTLQGQILSHSLPDPIAFH